MDKHSATASAATRRGRGKDAGRWPIRMAIGLCVLLLLSGCARQIYNVGMRYEPTKAIQAVVTDGRKYSLTVASFTDLRKMDDPLLVGRVIKSDGTPIPILPRYVKPTDAVAAALREVLSKSGYSVSTDRPAWDLDENSLKPEWGKILVGGTIDALDITCIEMFTMKRYSARVRVTLIFADVQAKRIFYRVVSESTSSLDHIITSEDKLESQINGVLSDAMEKAIEGPETGRQIQEALKK
jgi:hypothetical protein